MKTKVAAAIAAEAKSAIALGRYNELCESGKGHGKAAERALSAAQYWLDVANRKRGHGDGTV